MVFKESVSLLNHLLQPYEHGDTKGKQILSEKDTNLPRPHTALTTQTCSRKKEIDKGENVCDKQL